jgi:nucleotide-binding universal stress UspA family protein
MIGTILVGVDESGPSRAALRWSVERAKATGMSILIAHVVEVPDDVEGILGAADAYTEALDFVHGEATFATLSEPDVDVSVKVLEGDPLSELAKASGDAQLLVVGTHKTGFINGKMFGSRFLGLAAIARCAVAFIPDMIGSSRRGIVAAVDDSPAGQTVIRFAAAEAQRTSQVLTLIRSGQPGQPDVERALSENTALAKSGNDSITIRSRFSSKSTAEGLVDASSSASMLVVDHTRHATEGVAVLGSVAHDVLLNIKSPTLIVVGDNALQQHLGRRRDIDDHPRGIPG